MLSEHCRVGVQHKMSMPECAKMDAGADNTSSDEEVSPDNDSDEGGET